MKYLKIFRQQLGVSQKDFAALMGCSPGQLAMAESGLRKLPLSAHASILLEHTPATTSAAISAAPPPSTNEAALPALKKMQRAANYKLVRQQLLAENLDKKIAAANNMLAFAAVYQQQKALPDLISMQLEVLRRKAGQKKARYELRLLKCQLCIAGLEAMIVKADNLQSKL